MQVNRIIPNQIMAKVQNFKNKNILSKFKTRAASQTVPVVAAPLVAYMAINSEKYKNNVIYKSSVDSVKREFEKRELPFKEDYVNIYSGTYSDKGRSVLNSYDDTKQKFLRDSLHFDNSLVDTSTGKPNLKGSSILRNMQTTKEELLENGVAINPSYYNHNTGCLNNTGQNAIDAKDNELYFKGSPDDQQFASADPADTDIPVMQDDNSIPIHRDYEVHDSLVFSKDEMKLLNEMNNIDIRMDPVLQEIHDAPPLDTVEGLMTSIFGEIPAGVNFDWDLWSILKEIANDIIDIGDWI